MFPAAAASSAPEGRTQLLAEIHRTREEIERRHGGSIERYAEPEYARDVDRFWALAERWTSEYLDAHPAASTREIEADLATLANDLRPSAVRLTGEAVAVSKLTDDLLDRVAHHQDASFLASATARAHLAEILADAREQEEPEDDLGLGMLMDWKVRVRGNHRLVELLTDRVHLLLTIRQRSGRAYVTAVEVPASASD